METRHQLLESLLMSTGETDKSLLNILHYPTMQLIPIYLYPSLTFLTYQSYNLFYSYLLLNLVVRYVASLISLNFILLQVVHMVAYLEMLSTDI